MASKKVSPREASPIHPEVPPIPATPQVISVTSEILPIAQPAPVTLRDEECSELLEKIIVQLGPLPFSVAYPIVQQLNELVFGMPLRLHDSIADLIKPEVFTPEQLAELKMSFHEILASLSGR